MYQVIIGEHAERYYIKKFSKKYKQAWDLTYKALESSVVRLDAALQTDKAETISQSKEFLLVKVYFPVFGTKKSAKNSGCRAIVVADTEKQRAHILIVYHKSDLSDSNETVQWKQLIKELYPEYAEIVSN